MRGFLPREIYLLLRFDMCLTALPYMSRGSELINICSVAGFQPLTGLNTYAATKAFLLSWTKALHHELLLKGIKVTALCPYWVKDTEFIPVAKETDYAPIAKEGEKSAIRNFWFAGHAKYIVRQALRASRLNLWVCSPGPVAKTERLVSCDTVDCEGAREVLTAEAEANGGYLAIDTKPHYINRAYTDGER